MTVLISLLMLVAEPWPARDENLDQSELLVEMESAVTPMSSGQKQHLREYLSKQSDARWNWLHCLEHYSRRYGALNEPLEVTAESVIGACKGYAADMAIAEHEIHAAAPVMHEGLGDHSLDGILADGRRQALDFIARFRTAATEVQGPPTSNFTQTPR